MRVLLSFLAVLGARVYTAKEGSQVISLHLCQREGVRVCALVSRPVCTDLLPRESGLLPSRGGYVRAPPLFRRGMGGYPELIGPGR